ncbi:putative nucleotide-diphospho-sugar transferase [Candidatus Igneacidithiobacillus taiwanensis]|uniref:putative nucleotide-diphospho-sugar transferase n=1 Tax=Candidatus Igneacidithiobacillus taiwanensis TaxID=1945924 RepID=UPI002897E060|nr:putative nucleotide-diphospho-sugar transferase [Candidatus Igneacidithiobacillus taiwanensis]
MYYVEHFDSEMIVDSLLRIASEEFLPLCYKMLLRREFDEEGLMHYSCEMNKHRSRIKIINSIASSVEAGKKGISNDILYQLRKSSISNSTSKIDKLFDWIGWARSYIDDCKVVSSIIGEHSNKDLQISPKDIALIQQYLLAEIRNSFEGVSCLPDIKRFALESAIFEPDLDTLKTRFKQHYLERGNWVYNYFRTRGTNEAEGAFGGIAMELDYRAISALSKDDSLAILNTSRTVESAVIGLTTLGRPSLTLALKSLLSQKWPDGSPLNAMIVLNVPKTVDLELIDNLLNPLGNNVDRIIINYISDYGPITKLVGTLMRTTVDNNIILLADDDVTYPEFHFSNLINYHSLLGGKFAIGASGFNWKLKLREYPAPNAEELGYESVEGHLSNVDIIETWCGVCLTRSWFDNDFIDTIRSTLTNNSDILRHDDLFYSTYLTAKGIDKININSNDCNRYKTGFSVNQEEIKKLNKGLESLNGGCSRQMNWVRTCEYLSEIQSTVFRKIGKQKNTKKIALATICVGKNYTDDMWPGILSKVEYCDKYGYDFIFVRESLNNELPLIWSKFYLIEKLLLDGYDKIFYSDADVFITNPTIRLESIFASHEGDILVSQDINGINIGNLFVRNTTASLDLIRKCLQDERFHFNSPWYEQAAFVYHVTNDKNFSNTISICQKNVFNSYVNDWVANDFLIHLAGVYGRVSRTIIRTFRDLATGKKEFQQVSHLLSPFFPDYLPDPNRRLNLTPKVIEVDFDKLSHQDVYVANNNILSAKKFVVICGQYYYEFIESIGYHKDILLLRDEGSSNVNFEAIVSKLNSSIIAIYTHDNNNCVNLVQMLSKYGSVLIVLLASNLSNNRYDELRSLKFIAEKYRGTSITVRIEDIISDPNRTIELVGDFIGVNNLPASFREVCLHKSDGEGLLDFFGYRGSSSYHRDQECKGKNDPIDFLM